MISFTVIGKPEPAGSKRAFVNPKTGKAIVTDANQNAKPWQTAVATEAAAQMNGEPLFDGPLSLTLRFWTPRPNGHFGTGRNAGILKRSAPEFPTVRPDVLKLARAVEDALTGVVWRDDAQIVNEDITKYYGSPARCEVEIYELKPSSSSPASPSTRSAR